MEWSDSVTQLIQCRYLRTGNSAEDTDINHVELKGTIDRELTKIDHQDLVFYWNWLHKNDSDPTETFITLKSEFLRAFNAKIVRHHFSDDFDFLLAEHGDPIFLSVGQCVSLLNAAADSIQDYCLLQLCLNGGLRTGEISRLRFEDLNLEISKLYVSPDSGYGRLIPINQACWYALNEHCEERRNRGAKSTDFVFAEQSLPFSCESIEKRLQTYFRRIVLPERFSSFHLRFTFFNLLYHVKVKKPQLEQIVGQGSLDLSFVHQYYAEHNEYSFISTLIDYVSVADLPLKPEYLEEKLQDLYRLSDFPQQISIRSLRAIYIEMRYLKAADYQFYENCNRRTHPGIIPLLYLLNDTHKKHETRKTPTVDGKKENLTKNKHETTVEVSSTSDPLQAATEPANVATEEDNVVIPSVEEMPKNDNYSAKPDEHMQPEQTAVLETEPIAPRYFQGDFEYVKDLATETCSITGYFGLDPFLTIPEKLTTFTVNAIGPRVFANCGSLKRMTLPQTLSEIGSHAFTDCQHLERVYIGDGLVEIAESAFEGCKKLIQLNGGFNIRSIQKSALKGCTNLKSIECLSLADEIGEEAFAECKKLERVSLSYQLKVVEKGVFQNCRSLLAVDLPMQVTTIKEYAFAHCVKLKEITLPETAVNISPYAFTGCPRLKINRD